MAPMKTPTSSLSAIELLVKTIWYRPKLKIARLLLGVSATQSSQVARLPQELVEAIIVCLIYDKRSLLACSSTCYSWYIATLPHLHYTLTTDDTETYRTATKDHRCPKPLRRSYSLGLLPLIKRFRIRVEFCDFDPDWFNRHTLRCFSALTNLQELGVDYLQLSGFIPNLRRYFGHLSPTLRFLALKAPRGSCRQILYFVGFFPNLQDLKLQDPTPSLLKEQDDIDDASLVPLSVPPLRGRLTLTCFTRDKLARDMIVLFGGLRFRSMDLYMVTFVRLLLDGSAETLEALRLYPSDPYMDYPTLFRQYDLSRIKSLRTLETTAESITTAGDAALGSLRAIISTVTSPMILDVVIAYWDADIDGMNSASLFKPESQYRAAYSVRHNHRFKVFRRMHQAREFRLVLCADVYDPTVKYATRVLMRLLKEEKVRGGLNYLHCEPLVIAERRASRGRWFDSRPGHDERWDIGASAL